jgi:N-acyl-L-homoserine lactone synthetase
MIQEVALAAHSALESSFCDGVSLLLASVDCRPVTSGKEREAIFRLRQAAGMRVEGVSPRSTLTLWDPYDYSGNVYLFGLYIDDQLASSIRLHIASKEQHKLPSHDVFADVLRAEFDTRQVIVDCTRSVADEHLSRRYRELPYATFRFCMLAAEHFNADHLITAASSAHQAFYRRAFNSRAISEPRHHPDRARSVRLMTLNYPTAADELYRRYPFFRSTAAERQRLFGQNRLSLGIS